MSGDAPHFETAAIIGCGLIGASVARAMRRGGLAGAIIGADRDARVAARAEAIGVVDEATALPDALARADLIVLAAPPGAIADLLAACETHARPRALIIDVASTKENAVAAAAALSDKTLFVPCHPVAGTERSGPDAGFAELFDGRWCILTPLAREDSAYQDGVARAEALWRAMGAQTEIMDAAHHDLALAVTSHLPHLIAFTLVGAADDMEMVTESEIVKYSAGGFRDFTRIAASDPEMWRDVFLQNKDAVLETLGRFSEELAVLQRAIRWGDGEALFAAFARGRALRRAIVEAGQETGAANFGRDGKGGN